MLNSYDVKLSDPVQAMLDAHVILPGTNSKVTKTDTQQRLNQVDRELELDPEMILTFRKSMTWEVLQQVLDELKLFLAPILPQLDFLAYFYLHNCEMFNKQLMWHINEISSGSQKSMDASGVSLNVTVSDIQQLSTDPAKKLEQVINIY